MPRSAVTMFRKSCTIRRHSAGTTLDADGNEVAGVTVEPGVRCDLQQQSREETNALGEVPFGGWKLYLPPGTVLGTHDEVIVDGDTYEVTGPPYELLGSHVLATVERT